jgi:hypothetical protein
MTRRSSKEADVATRTIRFCDYCDEAPPGDHDVWGTVTVGKITKDACPRCLNKLEVKPLMVVTDQVSALRG